MELLFCYLFLLFFLFYFSIFVLLYTIIFWNVTEKVERVIFIKMPSNAVMKIYQFIETYPERFIADLKEAVAFKTVAGKADNAGEMLKMQHWIEKWLRKLNFKYECCGIGSTSIGGKKVNLPPIIVAELGKFWFSNGVSSVFLIPSANSGKDRKKNTVCVYARIDVKDADEKDWKTNPWELSEKSLRLYGRGTARGKAPLVSWFHVIEGHQAQNIPMPVNFKFIIEGMYEMGSFGMEDFLYTKRLTFLRDIDFICVCESEWLNKTIPCISYSTVGMCKYELKVTGDHKGTTAAEMLAYIFRNFVDAHGNILIPNINDDVAQITPDLEVSYDNIRCDLTELRKNLPEYMQQWDQRKLLMRIWQFPSLVECSASDFKSNSKTADPCGGGDAGSDSKGESKYFILKIVPAQTPDRCNQFIAQHIKHLCQRKCGSDSRAEVKLTQNFTHIQCTVFDSANKETIKVTCINSSSSRPWKEDSRSRHYKAAEKAILESFQIEANVIRESMDMPILLMLSQVIKKNILLLPLSNNEMDEKNANECVIIRNFLECKKLLTSYLHFLGQIKK